MTTTRSVLILCTGNSCRSQMAEGLWRSMADSRWQVFSAGSTPAGFVHPLAVEVMSEVGIDIATQRSKHVSEFATKRIDLVITVCDSAKESCPTLPGAGCVLHWPFDDPATAEGSQDEKIAAFRQVRDNITDAIRQYLQK